MRAFWYKEVFLTHLVFMCLSLESSISPRSPYSFSWRIMFRSNTQHKICSLLVSFSFSHILSVDRVGEQMHACTYVHILLCIMMHYIHNTHMNITYTFIFFSLAIKNIEFTLISSFLIQLLRFILFFFVFLFLALFSNSDKPGFHYI